MNPAIPVCNRAGRVLEFTQTQFAALVLNKEGRQWTRHSIQVEVTLGDSQLRPERVLRGHCNLSGHTWSCTAAQRTDSRTFALCPLPSFTFFRFSRGDKSQDALTRLKATETASYSSRTGQAHPPI